MKVLRSLPLLFVVFVCLGSLSSPPSSEAGDDWLPIDPAELASKSPVVDKDADAEALFWEVRIDDSQPEQLVLRHYVRIKVFTERGKESQSKVDLEYLGST